MTPEQWSAVNTALFAYWTERSDAAAAQAARGIVEPGNRAGVTAGSHLDYIAELLARECVAAGAPGDQVFFKAPKGSDLARSGVTQGFTLPGYFRPTKQWDLVVWKDTVPIVVIELKSQNGPSYSNNANNRAEEAVGSAHDFQRAKREELIPGDPWVGYAYIIEDDLKSSKGQSSRAGSGRLPADKQFAGWTYQSRIVELSHRLVGDGLYQGAWPVATSSPTCPDGGRIKPKRSDRKCAQLWSGRKSCQHEFAWHELDPERYGYARFIEQMTMRIRQSYTYSS